MTTTTAFPTAVRKTKLDLVKLRGKRFSVLYACAEDPDDDNDGVMDAEDDDDSDDDGIPDDGKT